MKSRLSVYLDPALMRQLAELAERKKKSMSLVAETAIISFLTPDEDDRREAAVVRRLDRLTRQVERLERDLAVSVEAMALFIRYWLTVTPSVPNDFQTVAQAKAASGLHRSFKCSVSGSPADSGFSRRSPLTSLLMHRPHLRNEGLPAIVAGCTWSQATSWMLPIATLRQAGRHCDLFVPGRGSGCALPKQPAGRMGLLRPVQMDTAGSRFR